MARYEVIKQKGCDFMRITIGEKTVIATNSDHAREIIKGYEQSLTEGDLIISHFLIDGVEAVDIDDYLNGKASQEIENITIIVKTLKELATEAIDSFLDYIPSLQEGISDAREKLTIGEPFSQSNWLPIIEGLDWTSQLLNNFSTLIGNENERMLDLATRWQKQLVEMLSAWEAGDTVLLADILEYEFLEILDELQTFFQQYQAVKTEH